MQQSKAIIFDLDGVICHTDQFHYQAWKRISEERNMHFDKQLNEQLKGVSREESYRIILKENNKIESQESIEKAIYKKNIYYRELLDKMNESYVSKEVLNTLKSIKEKGYLIAIGSSSKNAKFILDKINLLDSFDAISDGTDITHSKPHPEVFIKAANKLNVDPQFCYVVEDAYSGVEAGLAAKMKVFAYNQNQTIFNNKDVTKIYKISDILKYI